MKGHVYTHTHTQNNLNTQLLRLTLQVTQACVPCLLGTVLEANSHPPGTRIPARHWMEFPSPGPPGTHSGSLAEDRNHTPPGASSRVSPWFTSQPSASWFPFLPAFLPACLPPSLPPSTPFSSPLSKHSPIARPCRVLRAAHCHLLLWRSLFITNTG